ncbi:hypothetical protein GYB22_02865 [bacterium]|nr:hypothetical protein [bacterium]
MLFVDDRSEKRFIYFCSALVALLLFALFQAGKGIEGGMDSYNHYLISKYSWQHPKLLLDNWGKPIYSLLYSPLAQIGLKGLVALNILCLVGSALLSYRTALNLGIKYAFIVFVMVLLCPIFLDNVISGLTEPLSAFLLSLVLFLLSKKSNIAAAVVAGFLPYARSEGFVILALIIFYQIVIQKQYKSLLFLLAGSVFFNILGWIIEGEPLWIFSSNPYLKVGFDASNNLYGSGPWYHYLRWSHIIFGYVGSLLLGIGAVFTVLRYFKFPKDFQKQQLFYLILGILAGYYAAHSVLWWQGWMGSAGLIRVILVVAPCAAILAGLGLEILLQKSSKIITNLILLAVLGNFIYAPIKYYSYKYPLDISSEQKLYTEMYTWLNQQDYEDRPWAYMYPYLSIIADRDPWNRDEHEELWKTSLPYYKKGTILIWDGHFGPNEAGIEISDLLNTDEYVLLQHFTPAEKTITLNNHEFEIYVFEKLTESES